MKNKYIITICLSIVALVLLFAPAMTAQTTEINDLILNMKAIEKGMYWQYSVDENTDMYLSDVNYFIKVSGSPTYSFQARENFLFSINTNQLGQYNATRRDAYIDYAKQKWNWTLPKSKVLIVSYIKGNEFP